MIFPIICYHLIIIKQGTMVCFSFFSTVIIPNGVGDCQWWLRGWGGRCIMETERKEVGG
jgi:hypothetical protein